jgi:hypothetical protein
MLIYDQKVKAAARLQLTRLPDGTYSVLPHFVRKEQKLENAEYMGYTFTKEDAKSLKETGNLGKVVPLFNVKDNTMQDASCLMTSRQRAGTLSREQAASP